MEIQRGQRLSLADACSPLTLRHAIDISLSVAGIDGDIDFACFGLDAELKLCDERYMTFYNQPETPCESVKLIKANANSVRFRCNLAGLPVQIERLVFTVALNNAEFMRHIQSGYLSFSIESQETSRFTFTGSSFQDEKALMIGELYRKNHEWRFCALAQGFNSGLAALVKHFGGEVTQAPTQSVDKLSLEKKIAIDAPKLLDLAKKASVSLEKHHLSTTVARVGLVLDASGSMFAQYNSGKVQQLIERLLPLAVHFDDDGALDVWAFSNKPLSLPAATLQNYSDFIATAKQGWRAWGMMSINNEPAVIEQVIQYYQDTRLPVFIIFVSDGGVSQNSVIKKLLVNAAQLPIFWQFVGIGGRNYGILEKLDTLPGRAVDNCGFFSLDDLNSMTEQALYDRLLGEFPFWLAAAKLKNIVQ
jgi:stress response protein SCP2